VIAERIARARKAAGLSLRETAKIVGISQTAVQKFEKGLLTPSSTHLLGLSKAYGVRTEYFFRPFEVEITEVEYRKRANTPKKLLYKIEGDVRDKAERWLELMSFFPTLPVLQFHQPNCLPKLISNYTDLEEAAECVRAEWALGLNPIPHLIDTFESRGLNVITTAVQNQAKFDGLAADINGLPFLIVSSQWPGDRQRFTLAHELGHRLLTGRLAPELNEEVACNHFAGAFLMPKKMVVEALGEKRHSFELQELALLKQEFGMSMQSILYRAYQCDVIGESLHKRLFMVFSKNRWRKNEPGKPYPSEDSLLFRQLVFRALGEGYLGFSKAAELLCESLSKFHQDRKLSLSDATTNQ
jgi:Zn-dependent peptidase ImmA (M78 family)/DNA-binding XRE family transcriptional regulator